MDAVYADEGIWFTQKMMGMLYDVNVRTVNEHLKKSSPISSHRKIRLSGNSGELFAEAQTSFYFDPVDVVFHELGVEEPRLLPRTNSREVFLSFSTVSVAS